MNDLLHVLQANFQRATYRYLKKSVQKYIFRRYPMSLLFYTDDSIYIISIFEYSRNSYFPGTLCKQLPIAVLQQIESSILMYYSYHYNK